MRSAASSKALVTLASRPWPVTRMNRFRISCCSMSMKITRTITKVAPPVRQLRSEGEDLLCHYPCRSSQRGEDEDDDEHDRAYSPTPDAPEAPPLERAHDRTQEKGQQTG